jgi:predicted metal-dependent hydrolase
MTGRPNDDCAQLPSEELILAADQFNRGDWYICHETLEELWVGESGPVRNLYQGLLQVAVALHHWREENYPGAMFLLGQAVQLLRRVEPVCLGVDVAEMIAECERLRHEMELLGPDRMNELDRALLPSIRIKPTPPHPQA